jgi:hypothetical protein
MKFPKIKRVRDKKHLERVRQLECCNCHAPPPNHAHHIIGTKRGGVGLKSSGDDECIPLCWRCHRELHDWGHESWELTYGVSQEELSKQTMRALMDGVL